MPRSGLTLAKTTSAVAEATLLALGSLATYILVADFVSRVYSVSKPDNSLGAMWAVISAIFVYRTSYAESTAFAVSRAVATTVSFVICFLYLLFLPFDPWAMAGLIGLSALSATLIGRPYPRSHEARAF